MRFRKSALLAVSSVALAVGAAFGAAAGEMTDRGHVERPGAETGSVTSGSTDGFVDPQEFNLDDFVGFTFRGKPIVDLEQVKRQIDSGENNAVNAGSITYSFVEMNHLTGLFNNPQYGFTAGDGVNPFSPAQRAAARESIGLWDDLIAPKFIEKNGVGADIRFANSADPAQAYAYYPEYSGFSNSQGWKFFGDVFVADPNINWTNNWLGFNGYGATTLIHELGHSQGLSHPGAYNFDPNIPLNYDNNAEYAQDSEQYSIMSYWSPSETGAGVIDWSTFLFGNAQTPMLHDILTIQSKYGADLTTRTGDTVYGFNSNAGRSVYDFSQNSFPNVAFYDAGGNDTIDLSGFDAGVFIDLHAGSFSSGAQAIPALSAINANRDNLTTLSGTTFAPISQATVDSVTASRIAGHAAQIAADTGVSGVLSTSLFNLAIAYGTVIENAIGGSARDLLWGNEIANTLSGNGGDDVLNGFEGADTYRGGAGNDEFVFDVLENGDVVEDFTTGEDKINLRGTGVSFSFVGGAAFSGVAGELRYSGGVLSGDADGDGSADISVDLGGAALAAGDLLL